MTYLPGGETVPLDAVGTVAVVDLEAACGLYERDWLPFPLGRSRPVGSVWLVTREVAPIEDRLAGGDLREVREWVEAFARADVCVGCRVSFTDEGTLDLRVNGVAANDSAFVAVQQTDSDGVDIVDIYSLPPGDIGAAIAHSVGLEHAGFRPRIAVSGGGEQLPPPPESVDEYDAFGFPVANTGPRGPAYDKVDESDIVATGTVQSMGGGTRHWVQVKDDGAYLYTCDGSGYAEPIDAFALRACIDGLIGEDLAREGGPYGGS